MRVLIVEDDADVAAFLSRAVRASGWAADAATTGQAALVALAANEYDLAVLDVELPDFNGFEVCQRWRRRGGKTPILILTARGGLSDRLTGLDAGADDYLGKPFVIEELLARLRALARRPQSALDVVLRLSDLELDTTTRVARRGGLVLQLTLREYGLLEYLLRNHGRVQSRSRILDHVWDDNFDPVGNAVDVLIARVRRKVDRPGFKPLLHTVVGMGYVLAESWPGHAA